MEKVCIIGPTGIKWVGPTGIWDRTNYFDNFLRLKSSFRNYIISIVVPIYMVSQIT